MTAQLSGGVVADSLLYSFTPAAVVRGGSPMASPAAAPPPLSSARRHRAQSVPGEPTHRGVELDDLHMELHVGGSSRASATANLPSSSTTHNMASLTSGSVAMAPKPPAIGFSRCGSADRHQHHHGPSSSLASLASLASLTTFAAAGGGGGPGGSGPMPLISGGERGLPPMRHSISGNSGIGLPKLDLPAIVFGGGGGGPSDVPGSGRRSLSGGFCDTAAAAAFLDMPLSPAAAVFDGSAPPSPSRSSAPAVLAPLRVSGAFASACGGGGGGAEAAAGGGGWCGSGGGSFTAVGSRRYTPSAGVPTAEMGGLPFSPGPLLPCASESAVTTPLTPNVPAVSNPVAPPRRSHSLSSRSPASTQRMLGDGGAAADDAAGGLGGSAAVAISPDAPSVADRERGGGSSNTAAKAMYDINNDLQRAAGALLALHAPMCRPRSPPTPAAAAAAITLAGASAAPSPPPPSPPPPSVLTASQLAALKESAPELQWELRVAVRRIFQVLRQELSAAPGGRQLGSAVHECWATLDAYLECTTELTCLLVEGALEAREVREPPPTSSAVAAPASTSTSGQRQPVGGDGGDCVQEAQREAERLRLRFASCNERTVCGDPADAPAPRRPACRRPTMWSSGDSWRSAGRV
ncbi:hypothetical protein PLESTM_000108900 [Pleodorina starrii]|nr:hypothetical protein PLESTM_000108900 [Pleodorina starrii]